MKIHVDLSSEDSKQICKSISKKDDTSIYKCKHPHSEDMDESLLSGDLIDEQELENTLAYHDNKYTKKRKLGAKVAKLIKFS